MPEADWRDLIAATRKVIAVSGFIKDEDVPALLRLGFHDYLAKPFKFADLVDRAIEEARIETVLAPSGIGDLLRELGDAAGPQVYGLAGA